MKKIKKVEWKQFFDGDIVMLEEKKSKWAAILTTSSIFVLKTTIVFAASSVPGAGVAGAAGGLAKLLTEMLVVGDYICWGVLIFSGLSWMFGNKTVAIERGIGATAGYLIIRKSWDYVMFLKSI